MLYSMLYLLWHQYDVPSGMSGVSVAFNCQFIVTIGCTVFYILLRVVDLHHLVVTVTSAGTIVA